MAFYREQARSYGFVGVFSNVAVGWISRRRIQQFQAKAVDVLRLSTLRRQRIIQPRSAKRQFGRWRKPSPLEHIN